ncbi:MAG: RICIN domain-containing protein [Clostridia bacterium]
MDYKRCRRRVFSHTQDQLRLIDFGGDISGNPTIQMYEGDEVDAQKFKFIKADQEIVGEQLLEDGVYKIKSIFSNNKYIDVSAGSYDNGANIQLWTNHNVQLQKFQLTYNKKENYYEIMSVNSGKVLDVQSNGNTMKLVFGNMKETIQMHKNGFCKVQEMDIIIL